MASIFSKIIEGEIPSYKIAENDNFYAFLDIHPMKKGHTLVVPKVETDYFFDLDDDLLAELTLFAKQVAVGIKAAIPCNRVGLMVVGLDVPHAHIHLIPMDNASDMLLTNPKLDMSKEEFEETAQRIRKKISL